MGVDSLEDSPAHLGLFVCPSLLGHFPNLLCVDCRFLLTHAAGSCWLQCSGAEVSSCPAQTAGVSQHLLGNILTFTLWQGKARRKSRRERYLITSYCALQQFDFVFISKVNIFNLDLLNHVK